MKRRQFIQQSALGTVGLAVAGAAISCDEQNLNKEMSIPQKETLNLDQLLFALGDLLMQIKLQVNS